jgi:hypothetical protein
LAQTVGIAITGLPSANGLARFNVTYAPTGVLLEGYPAFSAGPEKHLFRDSGHDEWCLSAKPFDPATTVCSAMIPAAAGPVPTGARAWGIADGKGGWGTAEVTARELA